MLATQTLSVAAASGILVQKNDEFGQQHEFTKFEVCLHREIWDLKFG